MEAWRRKVYLVCLAQFLCNVGFTIVLPFLPLFVQDLAVGTRGDATLWIGFILAAQPLTMIVASPVWGMVADRFGRKLMLLRATLVGGLVMFSMSFAQSVEQMFVLRLLQGLTTGVAAASSAYVSAHTPRKRMGEALGWIATARWVGIASGPLIGGVLSDLVGMRASFWCNGAFMVGAGLLILFRLPEQWHYQPAPDQPPLRHRFTALLRLAQMPYLYLCSFLIHLATSFVLPVIALYVSELTVTTNGLALPVATATGLMFGLYAVTGALVSVQAGKLCDRLGANGVLMLGAGASVLVFLLHAFVNHVWQLMVLQALAGGTVGSVFPAMASLLSHGSQAGQQGAVFGLENSIRSVARTLAPIVSSGLAFVFGLHTAFLASSVSFCCLVVLAWWALDFRPRQAAPSF